MSSSKGGPRYMHKELYYKVKSDRFVYPRKQNQKP